MPSSTASVRAPSARRRILIPALLLAVVAPLGLCTAAASAITTREVNYAAAVLWRINNERRIHDLAPVRLNARLSSAARQHDIDMARYDTLSHQLPNEPSFGTRITRAGYSWSAIGENIAWSSTMTKWGAISLERAMYFEQPPNDGHRLNILNPRYRDVGVDVYVDNVHHKIWITTDYGRHA
jgi:uncharacterized protein YkwD